MNVRNIIVEALFIFKNNPWTLISNFLPAGLALAVISGIVYGFDMHGEMANGEPNVGLVLFMLPAVFVFLVFLAKSIVHTHRTFILRERCTIAQRFRFSRRDFSFIKKTIALYIVMMLLGFAVMLLFGGMLLSHFEPAEDSVLAVLVGTVVTILTTYIWCRFILVLPSAAVDDTLTLQQAWQVSKPYSLKLFLAVGVIPVVVDLIFGLLPSFDSWLLMGLTYLLLSVFAIVEIGILSLCYRDIKAGYHTVETRDDELDEVSKAE